jgi:hypothetical protein
MVFPEVKGSNLLRRKITLPEETIYILVLDRQGNIL